MGARVSPLPLLVVVIFLLVTLVHGRTLLQAALLHRHGARTEPLVTDHGLNWDICVLSSSGVEMALSLGRFTRQRYGSFLPSEYDMYQIESRTTDFERTIRTGVGVLRGMYDGINDIPYLTHKPQDLDFLLSYYYSWPSAVLGTYYIRGYNTRNNNVTLSYFPQEKLDVIGQQLNCPNLCRENQTLCALLGEDVSTCRLSNGGLSEELSGLFPQLFEAQERSNAFLYLYNESSLYWRNTGPYGRLLAVDVFNAFNATLATGASPAVGKFLQYSAHDVTIYGLFVALGVVTPDTVAELVLVPNFASAVYLDLYDDGNVSISFYECNQSYGSGFPYENPTPVQMGCMPLPSAVPVDVYYAAECPLQHFKNFVDLKAPQWSVDPQKPYCYADPADLVANHCERDSEARGSDSCALYRTICPEYACETSKGYVLNRTSMQCQRMFLPAGAQRSAHPPSAKKSAGWYAGVVIASLLIGIVLGTVIRAFAFERQAKSEAATAPMLQEQNSV